MSLFSSANTQEDQLQILWRIDGAGISVMVVDSMARVYFYDTETFTVFAMDDRHMIDQLLHHSELAMMRMVPKIVSFLPRVCDHATLILGEPWSHSMRRHITYKRKTSFKLTKSFINDLISRDMKRIAKEYQNEHVNLIDPTYHDLTIAGHIAATPWGKIVTDIRFDYVTGFSDDRIIGMAQRIIHEKMKISLLDIKTDHYQNFLIRFWKQTNLSAGLLIDGSGFVTSLYIFNKNQLIQAGTLPMGFSIIKNELASYLGIYPNELESLLAMYKKELLSDSISKKINTGLRDLYRSWESDFQKFCNHATEQGDILDQVIWLGNENDPILQFFMQALAENTLQFPAVFGTSHVGFLHSTMFIDALNQPRLGSSSSTSDQIIIAGLQ
jgi:uncharacterized membrane protein